MNSVLVSMGRGPGINNPELRHARPGRNLRYGKMDPIASLGFTGTREEGAPYNAKTARVPEKLIKCVWFDKKFTQPLKALDGRSVTILSPGWWNSGAGPDFLKAVYKDSEGRVLRGDVEIHVRRSDWKRHNHHKDKRYIGLALHVFLMDDCRADAFGPGALQIDISPFLKRPLESLKAELHTRDYPLKSDSTLGGCCPAMASLGPERAGAILDRSGESRFEEKGRKYLSRLGMASYDQWLYEALMETLGYRKNGNAFLKLARRVTYSSLREAMRGLGREEAVLKAQAVFLHHSGLIPIVAGEQGRVLPTEAWEYFQRLAGAMGWDENNPPSPYLKKGDWDLSGCRPSNYPQIRLAGAACLVERFRDEGPFRFFKRAIRRMAHSGSGLEAKGGLKALADLLMVDEPGDFWSRRHSAGGGLLSRPRMLIGRDRAAVALVNAVLPLFLAHYRRTEDREMEETVSWLFSMHPPLSDNSVQVFMNSFLLGERYRPSPLIDSAKRQQGLLHIYHGHCAANEKGCVECGFFNELLKNKKKTGKREK